MNPKPQRINNPNPIARPQVPVLLFIAGSLLAGSSNTVICVKNAEAMHTRAQRDKKSAARLRPRKCA